MPDFMQQQQQQHFVNLKQFMSPKISAVARPAVARPAVARPAVVRRTEPVNTRAELDAAERKHYAFMDAEELKKKHNTVIKTQKKLSDTASAVQATKIVKDQKKAAIDIVPNDEDKTQIIKEHNDAVGYHEDAKDAFGQAKKDHTAAKVAVQAGGRRRKTRHKRKSKRRKRHTKKRKRHTKKRKRHTKKRRSRRR